MDFTEAQQKYKNFSKSYFGGQMSMADFHREVRTLMVTDDQSRRWRINSHTGTWQQLQDGLWRDANPNDPVAPRTEMVKLSTIPVHSHYETSFSLEVALAFSVVLAIIISSIVIIVLDLT